MSSLKSNGVTEVSEFSTDLVTGRIENYNDLPALEEFITLVLFSTYKRLKNHS